MPLALVDVVGHTDDHRPLRRPDHDGQRCAEPVTGRGRPGDPRAVLRVADLGVEVGHREHLHQAGVRRRPVLIGGTHRQPDAALRTAEQPEGQPVTEEVPGLGHASHARRVLGQAGPRAEGGLVRAEELDRTGIAPRPDVLPGYADGQPAGRIRDHVDGVQAAAEPVAGLGDARHARAVLIDGDSGLHRVVEVPQDDHRAGVGHRADVLVRHADRHIDGAVRSRSGG